MRNLTINDLLFIAGGAGKSETRQGLLTASIDVEPHLEENNLNVMLILRDPLSHNANVANKVK